MGADAVPCRSQKGYNLKNTNKRTGSRKLEKIFGVLHENGKTNCDWFLDYGTHFGRLQLSKSPTLGPCIWQRKNILVSKKNYQGRRRWRLI